MEDRYGGSGGAGGGGPSDGSEGAGGSPGGTADAPVAPANPEVEDAAGAVIWDALGALPGVGTASSAVATGIDLAKAFGTDDPEKQARYLRDAQLDAAGMMPGVGTVLSVGQLGFDGATLGLRLAGATADEAPTVSGYYAQGASAVTGAIDSASPGTGTDPFGGTLPDGGLPPEWAPEGDVSEPSAEPQEVLVE